MVKNTKKLVEASNSTTKFRTIYREKIQIRRGKTLHWSTENLKAKSSKLILFNFQEAKFYAEKHKKIG